MNLFQQIFLWAGAIIMVAGNIFAFFENSTLKRLHYIGAGDSIGGMFMLISFLFSKVFFFKGLLAIIILIVWSPMVSYYIAVAYSKRGQRRANR
ncbi:monovalent cation/H(+) antiporter subunit G [Thermosipho ferrireducens]|uniref:Monovalent cation/H(+) antiporter subunit G n=1 Tax=Thermosipho ferrireducens TaxID=2571116 RepID=A0ABX7S734_9BACT|nr:monovalent cation/H(+) antiporter subunit G [Thermosipho ferrireducens]QTA37595.1 monovalent cation/H(+) antiporter subunit G [Thermosipho ferrireducens]